MFCQPLRPVFLLVSRSRQRSPVNGAPGVWWLVPESLFCTLGLCCLVLGSSGLGCLVLGSSGLGWLVLGSSAGLRCPIPSALRSSTTRRAAFPCACGPTCVRPIPPRRAPHLSYTQVPKYFGPDGGVA